MKNKIVCILAPQRSGTTVIGNIIKKSNVAQYYGEIFHNEFEDVHENFFHYLDHNPEIQSLNQNPTRRNRFQIFEKYITHLCTLSTSEHIVLDVKQNSIHHFNGFWHDPTRMPLFLEFGKTLSFSFLRIERENLFLQALSTQVAIKLKQYHFKDCSAIIDHKRPLLIDVHRLRSDMDTTRDSSKVVNHWLNKLENVEFLKYEELFGGPKLSTKASKVLNSLFNSDVDFFKNTPPIDKNN